jgi:hypothetical protein
MTYVPSLLLRTWNALDPGRLIATPQVRLSIAVVVASTGMSPACPHTSVCIAPSLLRRM